MAKEWYLLKSPHNQLSGFEDDALDDFAQEGFLELLDSSVAVDIELCNYDLSVCIPMRAFIQHRVDDTRLKTLTREVYLPIGTCKAGMYIKYKGRYWLIISLVDDNGMYEKGIMIICNHLLTWRTKDNRIIQRWANVSSASQYNNGETGNYYFTVRSDQLLILTPDDDDSVLLDTGHRFIIDKRCDIYEREFSNDTMCDTSNPVLTYKITRSDSVLYSYVDSGHYEFMVTQDEQHNNDGYYVIDGNGYWLCEENIVEYNSEYAMSRIIYDSRDIFNGLDACAFIAKFFDVNGNEVNAEYQWDIVCDFADKLIVEEIGNAILISANDRNLINKSFELLLRADGYETTSVIVNIRAFI